MKKILFLTVLTLALAASLCEAQYYGYNYYYPGYNAPPLHYYQQYAGPNGYPNPLYRLHTPPRVFRNLNSYSRMLEQEALERSPVNRESSLEYLLRTF
jgi:hypothetical protein